MTKICLHILASIIYSFLLILLGGSVKDSYLGSSVPRAMAPKINQERLLKANTFLCFLLEKINIRFQIIPKPNQRVPNCDKCTSLSADLLKIYTLLTANAAPSASNIPLVLFFKII